MEFKTFIDDSTNNFFVSPNFNLRNFQSPDTEEVKLNPKLVSMLEALYMVAGPVLEITSAYRTPEYNAKVGGAEHSYHLEGEAVDVKHAKFTNMDIAQKAYQVGFTGIIVHKGHVHLDIRPADNPYYEGFTPEAKSS